MSKNKIKVLIAPIEISGYYRNLSLGFLQRGIDFDYVTYDAHPFGYGGERSFLLLNLARWFNKFRLRYSRAPRLFRLVLALPGESLQFLWALFAMFRYDVFIFGFGCSLMRGNMDLPLLRFLGKRVIANLGHGADARPPYMAGGYQNDDGSIRLSAKEFSSVTAKIFSQVARIERNVSIVIGAPYSTSLFANKPFVNFLQLGIPISYELETREPTKRADAASVVILHAPSRAVSKGTLAIQKAIENLRGKGYSIEFLVMQGRSHKDVLSAIQQCDFVVDEIYSDIPMAGFACEAAFFGKPAVIGGYGIDDLKKYVSSEMWPPSMLCQPDGVQAAIEALIVDSERRQLLGEAAKNFVQTKWAASAVAERYWQLVVGDIPEDWWVDPRSISYLEGAGQPVERTKENIRLMVGQYGVKSLCLSHRPDLERALLKFSGLGNPC